jgi:hypothetical protein
LGGVLLSSQRKGLITTGSETTITPSSFRYTSLAENFLLRSCTYTRKINWQSVVKTGAAGSVKTGTAGSVKTGTGGSVKTGTAGSVKTGTAGSVKTVTAGSVKTGDRKSTRLNSSHPH